MVKRQTPKMEKINAAIGARIAQARARADLSQEALAERLDVSPLTVSRWETGSSQLSLEKVYAVSKAFGVAPEVLLGITPKVSKREAELLEKFRLMGKRSQDLVVNLVRRLKP